MTPTETLARTLYGEARGDGADGMTAVASVVLNRVNSGVTWWGHDIETVCLKPWQFSCWIEGNADYDSMLAADESDPSYALALDIAAQAVAGTLADTVNGATTYKVTSLPWPRAWGRECQPVAVVGHQSFYCL